MQDGPGQIAGAVGLRSEVSCGSPLGVL